MRRYGRVASLPLIAVVTASLMGCSTLKTPGPLGYRLTDDPNNAKPGTVAGPDAVPSDPTVAMLVKHVTCELYDAMQAQAGQGVWKQLVTDNFVAVVSLRLDVTDTGALSPNLSFIHPITGPVGSGSLSRVLAIAGSLSRTRDTQFLVNFPIDMSVLATKGADLGCRKVPWSTTSEGAVAPSDKKNFAARDGTGDYLGGDLDLRSTINDGLQAIDEVSAVSLYSSTGPTQKWKQTGSLSRTISDDVSRGVIKPEAFEQLDQQADKDASTTVRTQDEVDALKYAQVGTTALSALIDKRVEQATSAGRPAPDDLMKAQRFAAAASDKARSGGAKQPGSSTASGTLFSTMINFAVLKSLGGGPNWILVHFKGPGGGAGGGSGGGGAGGGGGGGGGNLLSYNTIHTDEVTITFSATCASAPPPGQAQIDTGPTNYWASIPSCDAPGSSRDDSVSSTIRTLTDVNLFSTAPFLQTRRRIP